MVRSARVSVLAVSTAAAAAATLLTSPALAQVQQAPSSGDRVLGLDVSAHQGDITVAEWATFHRATNAQVGGIFGDGRDFVFIRSSRGGTTGEDRRQGGYPFDDNDFFTGSQRYDDPYFMRNITRAVNAGMLAGSYHFSRPDVIGSTPGSGGVANTGTDEANHFIQMAGAWMRPGYLLPVHDFEAGDGDRTDAELTQFALDFSNRIYQVMGIRPAIYTSGNYAGILANSGGLLPQVVPSHPTLWSARWPNQADPESIQVQTAHPKDSFTPIYGPWDDAGNPHPWVFWQYASTMKLNGNNGGASNTDVNVAQGNIEFVKDYLVPALWMNGSSGNWHDLANWNSGIAPVAPISSPGQLTPFAGGVLPGVRLPGQADPNVANTTGADDTVNLNRPNENITVTLSTGTYNIRRLNLNETLIVTGGNLDARLTGWVGTGGTLQLQGGNVTFDRAFITSTGLLNFNGAGTLNVGTLDLQSNLTFTGASGTGQLLAKAGFANPQLNLLGLTRTFTVGDGSAATDLRVGLPLFNGNVTKDGAGTLELTGNNSAFAGTLAVNGGHLRLTNANQIGTTGVRTNSAGSVRVDGTGLNFTRAIQLGGRGVNSEGALQNVSGNNTWSGDVVLAGTAHNTTDAGLNRIAASAGTTLTLSGVIRNDDAGALRSWAKQGPGDVVLGGANPNTYNHLTRVLDGRLILEKDGALGTTNQANVDANTVQLAGAASAIAFRAPGASPGLNYTGAEWIFTEGTGVNGAQLDSLGGANTFAGHLGLGGPAAAGTGARQASIGVSAGSLEITGGLHARNIGAALDPVLVDVAKRGNGTLILSGTNAAGPANSFARAIAAGSTFTIEAGTVQLKGTAGNGENVAGIDAWAVNTGATLALLQGGAAGDAAVRFAGGSLRADQSLVAANPLAFTGNGALDAAAGVNATFAGNVTGNGGLTKSGLGNATLGGVVNTFGGAINVTGGTLGIGANGTNSRVSNANGLTIGAAARFDLADNDMVIRTTPPSSIEQLARNGYAGGAWDGAGGLNSSTAEGIYTLGVADNARLGLSSFGGHTGLTGAETLVKYTYYGDADLSGFVDRPDFLRFKDGFFGLENDVWLFGDFNYSGVVNGDDWALFLYGFRNQPGTPPWGEFHDELVTFAIDNGFDPTLVPEPGSAMLMVLGAGLLMRRQRRF